MAEQRWRPIGGRTPPPKPPRSEAAPALAVPLPPRSRLHRRRQHAGGGKQSMSAARRHALSPVAGGSSGTDSLEDDSSSSDDCAARRVAASKHNSASAPRAAGVLQPLQLVQPNGPANSAKCNGGTAAAPVPPSRPSPEPEVPAAAAAQRAIMMDTQGAAELLTGLRYTAGAAAAADVTLPVGKPSPPASGLPVGMATPQQGGSGGCGASRVPPRSGDPLGRQQLDSVPEVEAAAAAAPAAGELPCAGPGAGPVALQRTPAAGDEPPPRCCSCVNQCCFTPHLQTCESRSYAQHCILKLHCNEQLEALCAVLSAAGRRASRGPRSGRQRCGGSAAPRRAAAPPTGGCPPRRPRSAATGGRPPPRCSCALADPLNGYALACIHGCCTCRW
jgi:hypothetical protein